MKSGIILLNKPPGITSFDALREIKTALSSGKVGHTGTLDKFARGLLVVLCGKALKLTPRFINCDKKYIGRIHFGMETDTLDPEGVVVAQAPLPSREKVEQALVNFSGCIMQEPPVYSAIHINGKRASRLAREGKMPEMKKRPVTVYELTLKNWQPPFAEIFVHCSGGTYIRSLARDIALAAGSRAYLVSLLRTNVAGFRLEDAVTGSGEPGNIDRNVNSKENGCFSPLPVNKAIISALGLPWFDVNSFDAEKIFHGKPLEPIFDGLSLPPAAEKMLKENVLFTGKCPVSGFFAVYTEETLIAVVEKKDGKWKYNCVLPADIQP